MASWSNSPFSKGRIMATLTTAQHTSALVFGSFLLVHLAAPAVAVVAPRGESLELATKTMILGRVYYQNVLTEPLVVYASLAVHVISSIAKKVIQLQRRIKRRREENDGGAKGYIIAEGTEEEEVEDVVSTSASSSASRWTKFRLSASSVSIHTLTGLLLIPAVSLHSYLNRIVPASSDSPINSLSPSELDYSYVTYGFLTTRSKAWRYMTWTIYSLLLAAGAVHVVGGTDKIARRMRAQRSMAKTKKSQNELQGQIQAEPPIPLASNRAEMMLLDRKRRAQRKTVINGVVSIAGAAWLAAGLRRMLKEDTMSSSASSTNWIIRRLDACYASVWPYSMAR